MELTEDERGNIIIPQQRVYKTALLVFRPYNVCTDVRTNAMTDEGTKSTSLITWIQVDVCVYHLIFAVHEGREEIQEHVFYVPNRDSVV